MDSEEPINSNNNVVVKHLNSLCYEAFQGRLMSSLSKLNDVFTSNDLPNLSSVIQQTKHVKPNVDQSSVYDIDSSINEFSEQTKNSYESANSQLVHLLKPLNHVQLLERQSMNASENATSSNSLYVLDSNRKFNLASIANHSTSSSKEVYGQPLSVAGSSELGSSSKKFTDVSIYSNAVNYHAPTSLPLSIENYYSSLTSSNVLSVAPDHLTGANIASNGVFSQAQQVPPMLQLASSDCPLPQGPSPVATQSHPMVHTRGRKKSKKGPFICPECRKEFCNQSTLTKHMITHSDERKFVCPQCSKAFKRHDHLNGHMMTHRENKPYACDIDGCDKSYCDARSLRRHKEKHRDGTLGNDGLLLSQKLPGMAVPDKGISNGLYLPINASAQLQYLATQMQQQKVQQINVNVNEENDNFPSNKIATTVDKSINEENNFKSHEPDLSKEQLLNQSIVASENALLHQLLTNNHDKNMFKPPTGPEPSNAVISSTVIKVNDNYPNISANYMSTIAHSMKELEKDSRYSLQQEEIDVVAKKSEDMFETECTVCSKKFKTLSALNGHMRLHGGYFKLNHLLASKFGSENESKPPEQNNQNIDSNYSFSEKSFNVEIKENFGFRMDRSKEMNQLTCYAKDVTTLQYANMERHLIPSQFHPIDYASNIASKNLLTSSSIYQQESMFNGANNKDDQNLSMQDSQYTSNLVVNEPPKQINEVMFSPITPVTPLNKNDAQFTFDFSSAGKTEVESNKINCLSDHQMNYQVTLNNNIDSNMEPQYCFTEPAKANQMLEKNDIEMSSLSINESEVSFSDINACPISEASTNEKTEEPMERRLESDFYESDKNSTFNSFDLPSHKLTSDLLYRRLRKNIDDSNKRRELQSIKEIAASLQTFSQNFERHFQGNQQAHSYSVPNTPLVMGTQAPNHEQFANGNLSHHSLPSTPVNAATGSHFTFKVPVVCQQASSMPNTPVETEQQFNMPLVSSDTQPTEDILNSRNFDLTSCLTDAQYSDFMFNAKEIDTDFIDTDNFKQSNLISYDSISDNIITNNKDGSMQLSGSNALEQEISANMDFSHNHSNFFHTPTVTFNSNDSVEEHMNCKTMLTYIEPVKEMIQMPSNEINQNQMPLDAPLFPPKQVNDKEDQEIQKDINANYIIATKVDVSSDNYPKSVLKSPPLRAGVINKKPASLGTSSVPSCLKKKPRPEPLYIPPHVNTFMYQSRLRSPRIWNTPSFEIKHLSPPPYTPPPMLSPVRSGPGLFWKITNNSNKCYQVANKLIAKKVIHECKEINETELKTPTTAYEPYEYDIPQTDIQPHVNIGPNYQARIPAYNSSRNENILKPSKETLLWSATTLASIKQQDLDLYLKVSSSMCVPGQGNNKEFALHLLHSCNGNVLEALAKLVNSKPQVERTHPLVDYYYPDNKIWDEDEIKLFQKSILKHDKDFYLISQEVKTKSVKECIEFYYIWKKSSGDIMRRLRFLRRRRETLFYNNLQVKEGCSKKNDSSDPTGRLGENPSMAPPHVTLDHTSSTSQEVKRSKNKTFYPCPKCDRKFKKLKSRSAHMKIHCSS